VKDRTICPECCRLRASVDDEAAHNTGECGCDEARSLCWWAWNGERCLPFSAFDPEMQGPAART